MSDSTHSNLELKIRLDSLDALRPRVAEVADKRLPEERQVDTYFHTRRGRLKLRQIQRPRVPGGQVAHLIWYERENVAATRESRYQLVPVPHPDELKQALERAWGIRGVVSKLREIFLYRNVRIHLDQVEQLGAFLELEAVVGPQADAGISRARLEWLLERLAIDATNYQSLSYADLQLPPEP